MIDVFVVSSQSVVEDVVRVAAETASGVRHVHAVEPTQLDATRQAEGPSILVVDLDGTAAQLASLREISGTPTRIVVLTDRSDGAVVLEMMRVGVSAIVRTPEDLHGLPEVLTRVAAGERVVPPDIERSAMIELRQFARRARATSEMDGTISPRERQVLELLADGFTTHQVGRRLGISSRTVETHAAKLYRKLGVKTRIQAVARAVSLGLIELDR
jgi:DNA-binding NarL/FixJ family response regulator